MLSRARAKAMFIGLNAICIITAGTALAEGDAAKGEKVFKKCSACHSAAPDTPGKAGPNLHNAIGRTAGTLEGFQYSDAMVAAGAGGLIWTPETVAAFVGDPKTYVRGTKMTFAGLKKEAERADLAAYLLTQSDETATAAAPAPAGTTP